MPSSPLSVLIAGGGVAGLEAVLALNHLAGDRVDVTVLAPEDEFVFRPMSVAEPFARGRAERRPLEELVNRAGGRLVRGALAAVDAPGHAAVLADGDPIRYDALLVAVGARSEPAFSGVTTWTPERDPEVFGGLLRDLNEGYTKRVAFVIPPGTTWPLPGYELALMTAWQAWGMGQDDVKVTVYTHEEAPMAMFGPQATVALREDLVAGGVDVRAGVFVSQVDRRLVVQPGDRPLDAQRVVALPRAAARPPRGLPVDENGFIPVDLHGRVAGLDGVWAAGDATSFPIKQGGIASQLADAAAESIAAAAGAPVEPTPFKPVLRGVVLTGRGKRWIRRDLEGGDAGAVAADAGDEERHALWWPPTKVAGRYLSPFLGALAAEPDADAPPSGQPVELDLERDVASAADALRIARMRDETTGGREIPPTD